MAAVDGSNWREVFKNPKSQDGAWVKVSRHKNGTFFGQQRVQVDGKNVCLPLRATPALAAADVDRVIYKTQGRTAKMNGTLTAAVMTQLDAMSTEDVIAEIKATGGGAFSRGSSAYRGVYWDKSRQKWVAKFRPGGGARQMNMGFDSEEDAARQYDAWCLLHNRPLTDYNFIPTVPGQQVPAPTAAAAAAAAAGLNPLAAPDAPARRAAPLAPPAAAAAAAPGAAAIHITSSSRPRAAAAAAVVVPAADASAMSGYEEWAAGSECENWSDTSAWDSDDNFDDFDDTAAAAAQGDLQAARSHIASAAAAGTIPAAFAGRAAAAAGPAANTLQTSAMLAAWRQLHGDKPIPPPIMAQLTQPAGAAHHSSSVDLQQQEVEDVPPELLIAAKLAVTQMTAVLQAYKTGQDVEVARDEAKERFFKGQQQQQASSSQHTNSSAQQQQSSSGTGAVAPAAAAAQGAQDDPPLTKIYIDCEHISQLGGDKLLAAAAMCKAAATVTHHPDTIAAAAEALREAGGREPPDDVVDEIELGLRTAAIRDLKQMQPGGTHYWRGHTAWRYRYEEEKAMKAAAAARPAGSPPVLDSPESFTASAEVGMHAADGKAAAAAAIAAATEGCRICGPYDLQAAWLMQRLTSVRTEIVLRRPTVPESLVRQALADHGVDVIPGIDFEPVPGLHPELPYPPEYHTTHGTTNNNSIPAATDAPNQHLNSSNAMHPAASAAAAAPEEDTATPMEVDGPDTTLPAAPTAAPTQSTSAAAAVSGSPSSPAPFSPCIDWTALMAQAQADADAANYPFPLPCDRVPYEATSSEEEEDWEEEWGAGMLQGKPLPAADPPGSAAAMATSIGISMGKIAAAGAGAAASAAATAAGQPLTAGGIAAAAVGCRSQPPTPWDQAGYRRHRKATKGFKLADVPLMDVKLTGNQMEDTMAVCRAIAAEGDADHIPSHIRSYRIGKLVQQADPGFPLEYWMEKYGRPIQGEYCPVVLGVPPPEPDAPAAAAAAAADAATSVRPRSRQAKAADAFDPVNRRPPQALALTGCSYSGQKAAARRASAAAIAALKTDVAAAATHAGAAGSSAAAAAEAQEEAAARKLCANYLTAVGGDPLVQLLRPARPDFLTQPGGDISLPAPQQQQQGQNSQQQQQGEVGCDGEEADEQQQRLKAQGVTLRRGFTPEAEAIMQMVAQQEAAAAAARAAGDDFDKTSSIAAVAADAAAKAVAGHGSRIPPVRYVDARLSSSSSIQQQQGLNAAALATVTTAPRVTAGIQHESNQSDDVFLGRHPQHLLSEAADAATAAATAALQPYPMEVDWSHLEDVAQDQGLWPPAAHQAEMAFIAAQQAAKQRAAAITAEEAAAEEAAAGADDGDDDGFAAAQADLGAAGAEGDAGGAAGMPDLPGPYVYMGADGSFTTGSNSSGFTRRPVSEAKARQQRRSKNAAAAAAAAATDTPGAPGSSSSSGGGGVSGLSGTLQQQPQVLTGFIKADSCPAISAEREAALGIKMPRSLATVHDYAAGTPAARAAAAAVAALVPGGGRTFSSSETHPPAGSAADSTRVSYGAAERQQQGLVDQLADKLQQAQELQRVLDDVESACASNDPKEALAALMRVREFHAARDPDAWLDAWVYQAPEYVYMRAGGKRAWGDVKDGIAPEGSKKPLIIAACELGGRLNEALDAARENSSSGELDAAAEAAITATVLPPHLPAKARQYARLAARAGMRMEGELYGLQPKPGDSFNVYYGLELKPAPEGFWDGVLSGEVLRDPECVLEVVMPRVYCLYEGDCFARMTHKQQLYALNADIRHGEERQVVKEARLRVLYKHTEPGTILHDFAQDLHPVHDKSRQSIAMMGLVMLEAEQRKADAAAAAAADCVQ